MGTGLVVLANKLLHPLGLRLTADSPSEFTMHSALRRTLEKGAINTVIDMGASDGKWSLRTMQLLPEANYLAIEPLEERRKCLDEIRSKKSNFNYSICAAGDGSVAEAQLTVSNDLDGSTIGATGGATRSIPVKSIDALVSEHHLAGPFLLKFDTHGYEAEILKGATSTLKETSVIVMEVYNYSISANALRFPQMCAMLEKLGFRCSDLADPMLRSHDNTLWQMDLFFLRDNAEAFKFSQFSQ